MSPESFPATRAAIRRREKMYATGQIERPASEPFRDDAPLTSPGQTRVPLPQTPAAQVPSSAGSVTVDVTVFAVPPSPPLNISISVSTAGDGSTPDRPVVVGDRPSARRADLDLRNRMRRLGPAESTR